MQTTQNTVQVSPELKELLARLNFPLTKYNIRWKLKGWIFDAQGLLKRHRATKPPEWVKFHEDTLARHQRLLAEVDRLDFNELHFVKKASA